ncbi:MAG TPA: DJ-1/PfpI family protein [Thermoanaerobaculia bacterium]|jgi:putative intracellular protease/amidase/YHS domain-containing protein|nr:DJ-1/PfpI family protein [Thermoanaerobaculia bacterium]
MNRREFLHRSAALAAVAAIPTLPSAAAAKPAAGSGPVASPLQPPPHGPIPVAFLISEGAVVIDFCGPWEVFQDAVVPGRETPFQLYTIAESTKPIRASSGLKIVPDYTLADAPPPKLIVIPAQSHHGAAALEWVRQASRHTDVTMSVCTGAFLLAETGLLAGKAATTYHGAFKHFEKSFPDVQLKRGARFVEAGNLATAGGLSSGIDLALRVVERYFGREAATNTAYGMEYQGQGWMNPDSNSIYASEPQASAGHVLCPVCAMEVDPATAPKSVYQAKAYYFCSVDHKELFDAAPAKWL